MEFRSPYRSYRNSRPRRWSAAFNQAAESTRNRASSTSCFSMSSARNISVRAVVRVEYSRTCRNRFVAGSTAAYSQYCCLSIQITVSSSVTLAGSAPSTGARSALCTQSWTAFRLRSTPYFSSFRTVFESDNPPKRSRIPSAISSRGVRSRCTNSKSIHPLDPLRLAVFGIGTKNCHRLTTSYSN